MSLTGPCKSFADCKGWGFIEYNGQDVFCHINDCIQGLPKKGDLLSFDLAEDGGKMVAKNVSGGTGGGSCEGVVASFVQTTGYGFIDYNGQQIFVHCNDVVGGALKKGNKVFFEIEPSPHKPGQMVAKNVLGGQGPKAGQMDGKGGYGPMDMKSMAAGMMSMFLGMAKGGGGGKGGSPYGKSGGKGKDGGFGKGKDSGFGGKGGSSFGGKAGGWGSSDGGFGKGGKAGGKPSWKGGDSWW